MPVVVEVKTEDDYAQWIAEQRALKLAKTKDENKTFVMDDLVASGEEVYGKSCSGCHGINGGGVPGAFPSITGSPVATGAIDRHIDIIVNGKVGTAMQAFKNQLSAAEIAAVVTFQRNGLGNSVGDMVQPSAIRN
jgi:cytochrome c oxidase subunit 2